MPDLTSDINKDYKDEMRYNDVDRLMVNVHWWAFGLLAVMTILSSIVKISEIYPSPFSWRVISPEEAFFAIIAGLIAALIPTFLRGRVANHYAWRLLVATTITAFSYLLVFISGGAIEMHFMFFIIISLMAVYSDWRLGWLMLVLIALHHGVLNYAFPTWVYYYGRNDVAVIAHALPVLALVIFTTILSNNNRNVIKDLVAIRTGLVSVVEEREKSDAAMKKGMKKMGR